MAGPDDDPQTKPRPTRSGGAPTRRGRPAGVRTWSRRFVFVAIVAAVGVIGGIFSVLNAVEIPASTHVQKFTSIVCTAAVADGHCGLDNAVAQFSDSENRVRTSLADVSKYMTAAVIAGEDRNFYDHAGLDPWGILRAVVSRARGSASLQGGSTITQQYVKMAYLNSGRTIDSKTKEIAIALKLERKLSKSEILERYLNLIYFGRRAYGVEAAARAYFGKSAKDLDIAESAYLAGLIRNPRFGDAAKFPAEATRRRRTVLDGMVAMGVITSEQADAANKVPWDSAHFEMTPPTDNGTAVTPEFAKVGGRYILEWVRQQLVAMPSVGSRALMGQGLRIYLTINDELQRAAQASVIATLSDPVKDPQASLVSIDEHGQIVALIGGRDFDNQKVNLALGRAGGGSGRQAGSTFKPIALASFVEQQKSVKSMIYAPPKVTFPKADDGKPWEVSNFKDEDLGQISVEKATWESSNTAYAQIMMNQVGTANFIDMAKRLGISTEIKPNPSAVLGSVDVSVLEMATMYSTFANSGTRRPPYVVRRVEDSSGAVLYDATKDPALAAAPNVIKPEVAATVNSVLTGVVKNGTGKGARLRQVIAGKTGTTTNHRDAWFVGYTCRVTTAVWMGFLGKPGEAPAPMEHIKGVDFVTGGSLPVDIWRGYQQVAIKGTTGCGFKPTDYGTTLVPPDPAFAPTTTTVAPAAPVTPPPGSPPPAGSTPAGGSPTSGARPAAAPSTTGAGGQSPATTAPAAKATKANG